MTKLITTKQKVKLSKTQRQVLVYMAEAFDTASSDIIEVIPVNTDPQREGETYAERRARHQAGPRVKAIDQYRIRIPNTNSRSSWRATTNPTETTMKSLRLLGLVIDVSHRDWILTEAGRAALAGGDVFKTVAVQPKRVEFTITPAQAAEERRREVKARIASREASLAESARSSLDTIKRYARDFEFAIARFEEDPKQRLILHEEVLSTDLFQFIQRVTGNVRVDVLSREERSLVALYVEQAGFEEEEGESLERVKWVYPSVSTDAAPGVAK